MLCYYNRDRFLNLGEQHWFAEIEPIFLNLEKFGPSDWISNFLTSSNWLIITPKDFFR